MRIAVAQLNPVVGDVAGNLKLILDAIAKARTDGAEALVTSELALIGYPPRDLLLREGVVEACERAVEAIAKAAGDMWVLVGHPRRCEGGTRPLRNSVSICHDAKVIDVYDKQLLPGYDVFDEDRYFEPGDRSLVIEIAGVRCGVMICEDLWRANDVTAERRYPVEPVAEIIKHHAQLMISLNASPFVLGKWQKHLQQLSEIANEAGVPIVAVNQVGANDDQIFDGRSVVVMPNGRVTEVLAGFVSEVRMIDMPVKAKRGAASSDAFTEADAQIEKWAEPSCELFHAIALGIRDYAGKTGHRSMLLGLSGGIDSALAAALAAAAIGPEHVHGVMMPSIYSSEGSLDDSEDLAERLRLATLTEIPIARLHEDVRAAMRRATGLIPEGVTDENMQARLRGILLMAMSNDVGGLVIATSNKSEMAVGYSTLYGDMCGAIAPLADLTKTRIYQLAEWINDNFNACGFASPPIPRNSIHKPPSAELRPNQTDQDSLPPYDVLDQIIERRIELDQSEATIITETGFDVGLVRKTLGMIDRAQFKRDQAGVVLKVTGRAFGPGRVMPIVMRENLAVGASGGGDKLSAASAKKAKAAAPSDDAKAAGKPKRVRLAARK